MAPTYKEQIQAKAIELLSAAPHGMRFGALRKQVVAALPTIPFGTVHANLWNLDERLPGEVVKPARGLLLHAKFQNGNSGQLQSPTAGAPTRIKEEDFYQPFADWLVNELEECTKAVSVGGAKFKDKWGTPDVVGIRAPRRSDIIQSPTEIVSAEIKLDSQSLIVAFGQACAYKLFSHKSYIVVPRSSGEEDISRLDALCLIFGIGLILFDSSTPKDPSFEIRVRASRHEPDMFYVNQNMRLLENELFG